MTKPSIIYLHVGADKTGLTTIQKSLDANRHALMTGGLDDISSTYSHHRVCEIQAQTIVANGGFPAKSGVFSRLVRLSGALFHDACLVPVCLIRRILRKGAG